MPSSEQPRKKGGGVLGFRQPQGGSVAPITLLAQRAVTAHSSRTPERKATDRRP